MPLPLRLFKYKWLAIALLLFCSSRLCAADTLRVLFIGNSYTYLNQMPEIVKDMAAATGDVLLYQSSTPGGATFQQHCQYSATLNLIAQGSWDYVVLQGQSQLPSFPIQQVETECFPYARQLDSLIHVASPCAKTVFFRTWGRKNGDQSNCTVFPPVCTYEGMDSLLNLRYTMMADTNSAYIAPVGTVWHYIRDNNPQINLYQADESHPTIAGSFLAASCFYSIFFLKDPTLNSYNYILPATEAATIKQATKAIVFDSLAYWKRFNPPPVAAFHYTMTNDTTFAFSADSATGITGYRWDFGDGSANSFQTAPVHTFSNLDTAIVCLTVYTDCDSATTCQIIDVGSVGILTHPETSPLNVYPNPVSNTLSIDGERTTYTGTITYLDGRIYRRITITPPSSIRLNDLPPGIYLLTLQNKKGQITRHKIVKQ